MKTRQTGFITILMIVIFLAIPAQSVHAYTTCDGIERGDRVIVQYVGTFADTGVEFDSSPPGGAAFTITTPGLIQGFYEGLLGMKIGQEKTINVPASKAYSAETAPSPEFVNRALVFEVEVLDVDAPTTIETCENDGPGVLSQLIRVVGTILALGLVGFVGVSAYLALNKRTTRACVHCRENGRDRKAEGNCSSCGLHYCRASFSRGCPNCGNNSFIPYK